MSNFIIFSIWNSESLLIKVGQNELWALKICNKFNIVALIMQKIAFFMKTNFACAKIISLLLAGSKVV